LGLTIEDETLRGQRIFSTSVTIAKRTLAQVIILENFHLAKMEVQAILLEVHNRKSFLTGGHAGAETGD
jgi:hypothetical protein